MRVAVTFMVALLTALLQPLPAACDSVAAVDLGGTGEWQSLAGDAMRGTWSVELRRSGSQVAGTISLSGSNVFRGGTVNGTIDGQAVVLGVMAEGGAQATFSGKLTGDSISGEWECPAVKDNGVWYGTLRGAAGTP